MALLDALNPQQRAAAEHPGGPMLILAGAGSGKTRVITYRIAHLLQRGARAHQILAVTFTNKAAGEMRERVARLLGEQARPGAPVDLPVVGTFHGFCLRLLRQEVSRTALRPGFVVFDQDDARALVKGCERELGIDDKTHLPSRVLSAISRAKADCRLPEDMALRARRADAELFDTVVAEVYALYRRKLLESNACDFDDLLMMTVQLLETDEAARARWQERIVHLLVDEYQDTNPIQYRLIRLLSGRHLNVCAVGDEDQSIYKFRGATIRNILDFERDFPGTRVFRVEENYRSTATILAAANAVVSRNVARKGKILWTKNEPGEPVTIRRVPDDVTEADWVAGRVKALSKEHGYGGISVMYRTNAQSRVLEEAFSRARIPFVIIGGMRFYERKEVKDVLAYLRLVQNPGDDLAFDRVVNVPARGLGKGAVEAVRTLARDRGVPLSAAARLGIEEGLFPGRVERGLESFVEILDELRRDAEGMHLTDLVRQVIERTGYMAELAKEGPEIAQDRKANLDELVSAAAQHGEREPDATLSTLLSEIALSSDADALPADERVPLMTMHSAKGLEFEAVFLVGMEEGLFPHAQSADDPDDLEEERRLCYVGMTRARKRLVLVHAERRMIWGQVKQALPSRFLSEIPAEHVRHEGIAPRAPLVPGFRRGESQDALASFFGDALGAPAESYGGAEIAYEDFSQEAPDYDAAPAPPPARRAPLGEPPQAAPSFDKGDRVVHPTFGPGRVVQREKNGGTIFLKVYFDRTGKTVKLAEAHAKLRAG